MLCSLQDSFCSLKHLVRLDLSKNGLTELPKDFGQLEQLQRLDLYSNQLSSLPTSCADLCDLRWLDLKGNPIQTLLPNVVGDCLKPEECKTCARNVSRYMYIYREKPSLLGKIGQKTPQIRNILAIRCTEL